MKNFKILTQMLLLLFTFAIFIFNGCGTAKQSTDTSSSEFGDLESIGIEKSGATLWSENCNRCHNTPDPAAFNDKQWEAIGTHMKIRGGLPEQEAQKIIDFLQESN